MKRVDKKLIMKRIGREEWKDLCAIHLYIGVEFNSKREDGSNIKALVSFMNKDTIFCDDILEDKSDLPECANRKTATSVEKLLNSHSTEKKVFIFKTPEERLDWLLE